jgi:uncharacterized membrane protein
MKTLHTILLSLHILGGMLGLVIGTLQIILRKSGKLHRNMGKYYVAAMFLATLSGTVLAVFLGSSFLFLIGIFSFYLCYSGMRIVTFKRIENTAQFKWYDKMVAVITVVFAILMVTLGFIDAKTMAFKFNPVLLTFGILSFFFSFTDLLIYLNVKWRKYPKTFWLETHIGRMIGSYISAVTAFLVVNVQIEQMWIIWLAPTLVGSVLISIFIARFTKKINTIKA